MSPLPQFDNPPLIETILSVRLSPKTTIQIPLEGLLSQPLTEVISRIVSFARLPPNWDSYHAKEVDPLLIESALQFLIQEIPRSLPLPSAVPTTAGGIQLEWHCNGVDLEIAFRSPRNLHVWFEDLIDGSESEFSITDDFLPLEPLFNRLSRKN